MNFKSMLDQFESIIDKLCHFVTVAAPIAAAIAPMTGASAPAVAEAAKAAGTIATAVDKAIAEHQSAGATPQAAIVALATVAGAVAASGVVDAQTSLKIATISDLVSANPALYSGG